MIHLSMALDWLIKPKVREKKEVATTGAPICDEPTFSQEVSALVAEIVHTVEDFSFIRPDQIILSATNARKRVRHGTIAYTVPLRFREGSPIERRFHRGFTYDWARPTLTSGSSEILYLIYFVLPRFFSLSFRDRLETVIHELFHISPDFNGDLRRFSGRNRLHGCPLAYDARVRVLTDRFLTANPPAQVLSLLRRSEFELSKQLRNPNWARKFPEPRPKLIRVAAL